MSTLDSWQQRLEDHFAALAANRSALGQQLFALEHGLSAEELEEISAQLKLRPSRGSLLRQHWLPWVVYATEFGYRYAGDEYWPSFESDIPGWHQAEHRLQIKSCFTRFAETYNGVSPSGRWADWFTTIAWPITHAVLPKYLQSQFARVLHASRYDLAGVANLTPLGAGRLLSGHALNVSKRFEEFLEQEELAGRILLAMLADDPEPVHSPIHVPTLHRIVRDLERERLARDYLDDTRKFVSARIKGAARGLGPAAPRDFARNPIAPGEITVRPSLMLRPSGPSQWTAFFDFPGFGELTKLDPSLRDYLRKTRCKVSGADQTWLPAGWLTTTGQRRVIRIWPDSNKPLLAFECSEFQPQPKFLSNLLESECRLNPGSIWACRIRTDGLAGETIARVVRPGQEYVLLSVETLPAHDLLSPCSIDCEGILAAHLKMPTAVSAEQIEFLQMLGLQPTKSIQIWPAGAPARGWDGEGQCEWLTTEAPCFGIVHDHPVDAYTLRLNSDPEKRITANDIGAPVFVRLSPLPAGVFTLAVTAERACVAPSETKGHIVLRVREPAPWAPGTISHAGLAVILDPPDATLDTLWEGEICLTVLGPDDRQVECRIELQRPDGTQILSDTIGTYTLPMSPRDLAAGIRSIQERRGWELLDASSAQIRISGEELGQYTVKLERSLKPVRWVCRSSKGATSVRVIDDTGSTDEARTELFTFLDPVTSFELSTPHSLAGFTVDGQGGLFAVKSGEHEDTIVVNQVSGGLGNLMTTPRPRTIAPGSKSARTLLNAMALWSRARLAGHLVVVQRSHTLGFLQAWMVEALCGRAWAEAESIFANGANHDGAVDALKLKVYSNSFAAALKGNSVQFDTGYDGRKRFAEVAARYGICKDISLCEFALIWAHEPLRLLTICRNLDEMLEQAASSPVLLRGARLVTLLNSSAYRSAA